MYSLSGAAWGRCFYVTSQELLRGSVIVCTSALFSDEKKDKAYFLV